MSVVTEVPFERAAMTGAEMPDGLSFPEQQYFLSLKLLYTLYRKGYIEREEGTRTKMKLYQEFENFSFNWGLGEHWAKKYKDTESALCEYRKNRTLENADKLVDAFSIGGTL